MDQNREKPWNFQTCKFCPYRSRTKFVMDNHLKLHGRRSKTDTFICGLRPPELLKCEFCKSRTGLKVYLMEHFRVFHEGRAKNEELENMLKCFHCNCGFETHSVLVLTKHILSCRNKRKQLGPTEDDNYVKWHKCKRCTYKSTNGKDFAIHSQRHQGPYWHMCAQCNFKTHFRFNLKQHMVARHTDPGDIDWFKCVYCPYKTKQGYSLKMHNFSKHIEHVRPEDMKWYECGQCVFKTITRRNLKQHIIAKHPTQKI